MKTNTTLFCKVSVVMSTILMKFKLNKIIIKTELKRK